MRKLIWSVLVGTTVVLCNPGCSAKYWTGIADTTNRVRVSKSVWGASFEVETNQDTKHVLNLDSVKWNAETAAFELAGLHSDYNGSASAVITADVERVRAVADAQRVQVEYQRAVGDNIRSAIQAGGEAASIFLRSLPKVTTNIDTPIGSGGVSVVGQGVTTSQPSN